MRIEKVVSLTFSGTLETANKNELLSTTTRSGYDFKLFKVELSSFALQIITVAFSSSASRII